LAALRRNLRPSTFTPAAGRHPAAKTLRDEGYGESRSGDSEDKETQAQVLLEIALEHWELTWWDEAGDGEPFAIERGGPNLAYPMKGSDAFEGALANAFYELVGKPPSNEALSQAMKVLSYRARRAEPRRLWVRVAQLPKPMTIYLDVGDAAGRCVALTEAGWDVLERSPVTFRRTAATRPLPEPARDGDVDKLWFFTRIAEEHRPLVKAWLVHAYFPDQDHAILRVTGRQDAGKTQTCNRLVAIVDPAVAQLRGWGRTRDIRDWVAHATASWVSGLENISSIDPELDDALCRSSTGDAVRDRKYYSQGDVDIKQFRRVVLFNDISLGMIKGDLIDRLLEAGLPPLNDKDAIPDDVLEARWRDVYPAILGGFYDYIVKVLRELPGVEHPPEGWPRPRSYSRILAAVDRVDGTDGMATWREMKARLKADLAQGDLVALCLRELMKGRDKPLEGTATEWLRHLADAHLTMTGKYRPPSDRLLWPQSERALSAWFKRLEPTVAAVGLGLVEKPRRNNHELTRWEVTWKDPNTPEAPW
jgi:hypothetical protein